MACTIYRASCTVPVTASAHYYLKGSTHIKPYIGIGLGAAYADQAFYFNIFSVEENNWGLWRGLK